MTPVRFHHVLRSEWTKLRSLRSTVCTLLAAGVLAIGLSVLFANGAGRRLDAQGGFDPTAVSLQSFILVQLAISVLGVLVVTSEYGTGMIRTSLTAVPRRGRLLAAKALVFGAVALVCGQVVAFTSFLVGQAILNRTGLRDAALGEPGVLRAVIGCGLYLAMIGLLGVAVGVLTRTTAGAIMIMVAATLLVPLFTPALPESWAKPVGTFGPFGAGTQVMSVVPEPGLLTPWTGFGVLCLWVLGVLGVAALVFECRDA
ncbi:ABC transporter permease [Actinomadura sp. SCN-SB]|uniref:ABC transporter permease n=1 Tax=Actinomadura sp. SCN-SB TaxID=3373092 RepID=UPI003751BFCB